MSTSPENNGPTSNPTSNSNEAMAATSGSATEPEVAAQEPVTEAESAEGAEPRPGGMLSAETFSLVSLFLLALTVLSGRLVELLTTASSIGNQAVTVEQVAQVNTQTIAGGLMAVATVLAAVLALLLAGGGTRHWARWASSAALITGLLFVLVAVLAYAIMPAGVEPPPPTMPTN